MENNYGLYGRGSSGWTSLRNEEFQEEDVWSVLKEREDFTTKVGSSESSSSAVTLRRLPAAARMIPRANKNTTQEPRIVQHSAPVNIPDWSKIYGKSSNSKKASKQTVSWLDDDGGGGGGGGGHGGDYGLIKGGWDSDEDDDDSDGNMMPPHEWIARNLRRSQTSSFSVCEGAGRTLKGRDLSRVRNAVLTRTGFLE